MEKAYEWQNSHRIENFAVTKHGKVYYGPHKWIVCLLGDDVYSVNLFKNNHKARLAKQ